jgi:hypothetical protein
VGWIYFAQIRKLAVDFCEHVVEYFGSMKDRKLLDNPLKVRANWSAEDGTDGRSARR